MYGTFTEEHLKKMTEGIKLFNEEAYWECHEELEDPWMEDPYDKARYVYWAVIQIAASLVHVQNERIVGAKGMLKKALKKFEFVEVNGVETKVLNEKLQWSELKNIVRSIPEESSLEDFKKLHQFKFKNWES